MYVTDDDALFSFLVPFLLLRSLPFLCHRRIALSNKTLAQKEAFEEDQKFKEGMVVLEKALISKVKGA